MNAACSPSRQPREVAYRDVNRAVVLAYLGGLVDGDGYFKLTKNFRTPRIKHPYFANVLGVAQLWPGPAVRLFAETMGGDVKRVATGHGTWMARCELRGEVAKSASRHLAPFLLVKRTQALLFLEALWWRPTKHGRTMPSERGHERVEVIARALRSVQRGTWHLPTAFLPLSVYGGGYHLLAPDHLGWTREETLAYLAGIMDSDGNFRISRRHVAEMRWPQYRINIRCAQVPPSPAVELLAQTFGGRVTVLRAARIGCRNLIAWNLHDRVAVPAIEALLPYLRVKWADACILLELRHLKSLKKEDLTEWVHRNRWQRPVEMRKRSFSHGQVLELERLRLSLHTLHENARVPWSTVPATPGSAACPTSACSSPSRSRSPRGDRSG